VSPLQPTSCPVSRLLHHAHGARTRAGRGCKENEDTFIVDRALGLFAIADGIASRHVGGHASALVLAVVREAIARTERGLQAPPAVVLRAAVEQANLRLLATAEHDPARYGMGTTFTGALARGATVAIAHLGDSRAYLLHGGRLARLTEDHVLMHDESWGALDLEHRAELKEVRRGLLRAVGIAEQVDVSIGIVEPQDGDVLLLCTDRLTAVVREKEIARILLDHREPFEAAERLVACAGDDGDDEVTALVVRWAAKGEGHGRA
jgi:PPM family protein phosphatase